MNVRTCGKGNLGFLEMCPMDAPRILRQASPHAKIHAATARYLPTLASRAKHYSIYTSGTHVWKPKYACVILKTPK